MGWAIDFRLGAERPFSWWHQVRHGRRGCGKSKSQPGILPAGAKALTYYPPLTARLKSCPDAKRTFSAACEAVVCSENLPVSCCKQRTDNPRVGIAPTLGHPDQNRADVGHQAHPYPIFSSISSMELCAHSNTGVSLCVYRLDTVSRSCIMRSTNSSGWSASRATTKS